MFRHSVNGHGPAIAPPGCVGRVAAAALLSVMTAQPVMATGADHADAVFASMRESLSSMQSTTAAGPARAPLPAGPSNIPGDPRTTSVPRAAPAPATIRNPYEPAPSTVPQTIQNTEPPQYRREGPRRSYDTVPKSRQVAPAGGARKAAGGYKDGWYVIEKDYWLNYPLTLWRMATAPTRFDTKDWLITAGVVGATGIFLALDEEIQSFWQDNITGSTSEDVFDVLNVFGDTKYVVGGAIGLYAVAEALDQTGVMNARRAKATGLLTAQSVLIAQGITGSIKWLAGRDRPNETDSRFDFKGPGNGDNKAFPSGHATVAFALATTVSELYGPEYRWVPWIVYPLATGTALSRVDRNKHWASDVFLGGVIGYAVAKTVTHYNPFLEKHDISFRQLDSVDGPGLLAVRTF